MIAIAPSVRTGCGRRQASPRRRAALFAGDMPDQRLFNRPDYQRAAKAHCDIVRRSRHRLDRPAAQRPHALKRDQPNRQAKAEKDRCLASAVHASGHGA